MGRLFIITLRPLFFWKIGWLLQLGLGVAGQSQREILDDIYLALSGPNWINKDGWEDTTRAICTRFGVVCRGDGTVTSLQLPTNNLVQAIGGGATESIYMLEGLELLDLRGNAVPLDLTILPPPNLHSLFLSETRLTTLAGIEQALNLTTLHVNDNIISGTIPPELFRLTKLQELQLQRNFINGGIPYFLAEMTALEVLDMSKNGLWGTFPVDSGALSLLPSLRYFDVSDNTLSGPIPFEYAEFSKLTFFGMARNVISGPIPGSFLQGIVDKSVPIAVRLEENKLVGPIPVSLDSFLFMDIHVGGNLISVLPTELCDNVRWSLGNVGRFGCNAILCPPDTWSSTGRQESAVAPCEACPEGALCRYFGTLSGDPPIETGIPTQMPLPAPSLIPSSSPSTSPSVRPSVHPSGAPSAQPTDEPTSIPSVQPTGAPADNPSPQPTRGPSDKPSDQPTSLPSGFPSMTPTMPIPTVQPTVPMPSGSPSGLPSLLPSRAPSLAPSTSLQPSETPSGEPSAFASGSPSVSLIPSTSTSPSIGPTESSQPSAISSSQPSVLPSDSPSSPVATSNAYKASFPVSILLLFIVTLAL